LNWSAVLLFARGICFSQGKVLVTGRLKQVWSWEKTVAPPPTIG
jgi:hypothetical protein